MYQELVQSNWFVSAPQDSSLSDCFSTQDISSLVSSHMVLVFSSARTLSPLCQRVWEILAKLKTHYSSPLSLIADFTGRSRQAKVNVRLPAHIMHFDTC